MAQDGSTGTDANKDYKPLRTPMASKVRFGITAGINSSKFYYSGSGTSGLNTTMKVGPFGGAYVNLPLGSVLAIQPGVTYNIYGSKGSLTSSATVGGVTTSSTTNFQEDLHYISVPVAVQIKPGNTGFFIEAGPQANFLVAAKFKNQTPGSNSGDRDNKDDYDNFDFSAFGGLGYITRIGLGFEAKYNAGFNNVLNDTQAGADNKWKNRAWTFGLFYNFGAAK
ncbi:porin family protein [Flaviaesturariibacter aridisoli]|nr:porin family protein [Flaviaesturariibacter aridisoli]